MKNDLFEKAPIPKAYFTLALPVVLSMVVSLIYNMVDTYFIALTQNVNLVAGVSICAPLFTLMIAIGDIYGLGGSSLISRMFGRKEDEQAKRVSSFCFYGAIVTGLVVTLVMILFEGNILHLLGAKEGVYKYAREYYRYIAYGAPFIILALTPSNLMRTEGLALESMIGTICGSVVNIILDPIFIFTLKMDAGGAAFATVLGNVVSNLLFVYLMKKKSNKLSLDYKLMKIRKEDVKDIFSIGIPASITNLMASFAVALINVYLIKYGSDKVAAMGIALKVNMIIILVMVGFAFGAQPLIGYNYGARNFDRLKKIIRFDILVEIVFSVTVSIILMLLAPTILSFFMKDQAIISSGTTMLRWLSLSTPCIGIILVFTTLFQSYGKALPAFVLSVSRQGVVYLLSVVILSSLLGYNGIIASQACSDVITMIIGLLFYMSYSKKIMNK